MALIQNTSSNARACSSLSASGSNRGLSAFSTASSLFMTSTAGGMPSSLCSDSRLTTRWSCRSSCTATNGEGVICDHLMRCESPSPVSWLPRDSSCAAHLPVCIHQEEQHTAVSRRGPCRLDPVPLAHVVPVSAWVGGGAGTADAKSPLRPAAAWRADGAVLTWARQLQGCRRAPLGFLPPRKPPGSTWQWCWSWATRLTPAAPSWVSVPARRSGSNARGEPRAAPHLLTH